MKPKPTTALILHFHFNSLAPQIKLDFPFRHPVETSVVKGTPLHWKNCLTCIICQLLIIFYSGFYSDSCNDVDKKEKKNTLIENMNFYFSKS